MRKIKEFNEASFINFKLTSGLFVSAFGLWNLYNFIEGMEANVFGFFFFLPLFILSCVSILIFFGQLIAFFSGYYSKK